MMNKLELLHQIQVFKEKLGETYKNQKSAQAIKSHTEAILYLYMLEEYLKKMQ